MSKRYKVLYVARTARGGSAFVLYHLADGLNKNQYEPSVLFHTQEHPYIGQKLADSGIKVITLEKSRPTPGAVPNTPVKRRDVGAWLKARFGKTPSEVYISLKACYHFIRREAPKVWPIVKIIRNNQIDLVHLNDGLRHSKPGILAAWLTRTPCVVHVHMFHELNYFDRIFSRLANAFIYVSRAIGESYVTQGIPAVKGQVIHNGIDLSQFSADYDATTLRGEFGWGSRERLVGVVGRLDWWKGHEYFLQAVDQAAQQFPNLRALIIGESENTPANQAYYQKLLSLRESLGLEDKVVFTGFRSDVPRLVSALDVLVLSSSTPEPFGLVIIEGMAAGKPVVATAAGGVLDIIEDGHSGLLVPCKDPEAMAEAISRLLSNREQANHIGQMAQQRVKSKFTVTHNVAAVQSLYDVILDADHRYSAPIKVPQ